MPKSRSFVRFQRDNSVEKSQSMPVTPLVRYLDVGKKSSATALFAIVESLMIGSYLLHSVCEIPQRTGTNMCPGFFSWPSKITSKSDVGL